MSDFVKAPYAFQTCKEPKHIVNILAASVEDRTQEEFWVFLMDSKLRFIGRKMVTRGIIDRTVISPAVIFKYAILQGAVSIMLAHNHPSGDPTPSSADISITNDLIKAGELLRITIKDSVVVGLDAYDTDARHRYVSMREQGLM